MPERGRAGRVEDEPRVKADALTPRGGVSGWDRLLERSVATVSGPRAHELGRHIIPHVVGPSLLDIGCGTGHLGAHVAVATGCRLTLLDARPRWGMWGVRWVGHPSARVLAADNGWAFHLTDGRRLPLGSDSVDTVLLAFVLHHASDPGSLFREAARVARARLIVVEDEVPGGLRGVLHEVADAIVNLELFGHPHDSRDRDAWVRLFRSERWSVAAESAFDSRLVGFPFSHRLFVLEPSPSASEGLEDELERPRDAQDLRHQGEHGCEG